jgi:hypothetical protein
VPKGPLGLVQGKKTSAIIKTVQTEKLHQGLRDKPRLWGRENFSFLREKILCKLPHSVPKGPLGLVQGKKTSAIIKTVQTEKLHQGLRDKPRLWGREN